MDIKTVREMLQGAQEKDYIEIISRMTVCGVNAEQVVLEWCKKNNKGQKNNAYELELKNLWHNAGEIIYKFNCYGGGPDADEEKAADDLWRMGEIAEKHKISWETRKEILDEMMEELNVGNSGFDDLLVDIAVIFCKKKDEKKYLADVLAVGNSDYYRGYAARLYNEIGEEDNFLQTRLANLRYSTDYIEVAEYYAKKGDSEKEREYIWKGLTECDGRLDGLIDYIAPIYKKEKNESELERLYKFILKTKWNINIVAIAKQLYEYSDEIKDYESKKKMLMLIMDSCEKAEIEKWFYVCKETFKSDDWKKEYSNILEKIRKKNTKFYLDLCLEAGDEKTVLDYLKKQNHGYDYWDLDYGQYFSKRLFLSYPEEILSLYWRDVNQLLSFSNNKNYAICVKVLKNIKTLMKRNKQEKEWEEKFSELKEVHKRKKNFMMLVKDM